MTKTRLQLQRTNQAGPRRGAFATLAHVARTEGVRGVYGGVCPAMARHVPYSGVRIVVYEQLRNASLGADGSGSVAVKMALGATSGAVGQARVLLSTCRTPAVCCAESLRRAQLVAVPADLVKVRMQADRSRYRGLAHAFVTIVREEGVAGLWRGTLPAVERAALVNLGELATYDAAKRWAVAQPALGGEGVLAHVAASLASGFVATVASCPADVLKTRLMNQKPGGAVQYRGMLDCLRKSVTAEGVGVLYRGFWPTWARLGPWQLTFWLSYEQLRRLSGMGAF